MQGTPRLPGDACAAGATLDNVAPANNVAAIMVSFMTFSGLVGVAVTKPARIIQARLLASQNKIKVHARAIRLAQRAGSLRDEKELPGSRGPRGAALVSAPIAVLPCEGNKNGDQSNHNQHPVLAVESQKGKMFNEKLQTFPLPPFFVQNKHFAWAR
jgi:hypothetical protein